MVSTFFTKFMQRPMDRKTFVKTLLVGAVLVTGVGGVVRLLGTNKPQSTGSRYGSSAYGNIPKQ